MPRSARFHGLFMGVNRHASPAVSELRFAEADATALHALFADTLDTGSELLMESEGDQGRDRGALPGAR